MCLYLLGSQRVINPTQLEVRGTIVQNSETAPKWCLRYALVGILSMSALLKPVFSFSSIQPLELFFPHTVPGNHVMGRPRPCLACLGCSMSPYGCRLPLC